LQNREIAATERYRGGGAPLLLSIQTKNPPGAAERGRQRGKRTLRAVALLPTRNNCACYVMTCIVRTHARTPG